MENYQIMEGIGLTNQVFVSHSDSQQKSKHGKISLIFGLVSGALYSTSLFLMFYLFQESMESVGPGLFPHVSDSAEIIMSYILLVSGPTAIIFSITAIILGIISIRRGEKAGIIGILFSLPGLFIVTSIVLFAIVANI